MGGEDDGTLERLSENARNTIVQFWTLLNEGCPLEPCLESVRFLVEEFDGALQPLVCRSLFCAVTKPEALEECCKHIDEDIHPAFHGSPLLVPGHHAEKGLGVIELSAGVTVSQTSWPLKLDLKTLDELINLNCDVGFLSMRNLRSWLSMINAVIIDCEGSEAKLRFRYALLPPFCVFISQIPQSFPEFVSRIYDYIDNWVKRRTFDSTAIDLLYSCARGKMSDTIPECIGHTKSEIAASFVKLRTESMGIVNVEEQSTAAVPTVLPKSLMDLMEEWDANDPQTTSSATNSAQIEEWYGELEKSVDRISELRNEIQEKFASLLAKHEHTYSHEELERAKPQTMVLIKRELGVRCHITKELTKLITLLDLRHAQLSEDMIHFANLLQTLSGT